jgi:hypothetical protein
MAACEATQALPPEGATAATEAVIKRNAELVEAMDALRCCLRDEHSNLVQVTRLCLFSSAWKPVCLGVIAGCA